MNVNQILEVLFENTTLIGTFIIIGGLIKVFTYYKFFGVYIFEFFEIKEVLTLFANNLFAYFAILVYLIVLILFKALVFIPICFSVLTFLYFLFRKNVYLYEIAFQNLLFWSIFFIVINVSPESIQSEDSDRFNYYFLIILLFTLVFFSLFNAINECYKVKKKGYYSKTIITIGKETFKSTESKFYIGKTNKYLFIYDKNDKHTEVIPMDKIVKIIFNSN